MAQIRDFSPKPNKKFERKPYRPWGLEESHVSLPDESKAKLRVDESVSEPTPCLEIKEAVNEKFTSFHTQGAMQSEIVSVYKKLEGVQKNLLNLMIRLSKENGNGCSGPITIFRLNEMIHSNIHTTRKSVVRLCEKGLIKNESVNVGRYSYSNFRVHEDVMKEALVNTISENKI